MNPNNTRLFDALAEVDERFIEGSRGAPALSQESHPRFSLWHLTARKKRVLAATLSFVLLVAIALPLCLRLFGDEELGRIAPVKIAVIPESDRIAVGEDLTVSVYCVCRSAEDEKTPTRATARVMMSYSSDDPNNFTETVKEIDDARGTEYTWNGSYDTMRCETLTVPAEIFTKGEDDGGVIVWSLEVEREYSRGKTYSSADSVAYYYDIKDGEISLKVEEDTLQLAKAAVEKLADAQVFNTIHDSSPTPTTERYNSTAKWVAPEVTVLETKSDAALALILLYEEMLKEFRALDLESYYEYYNTHPLPDYEDRPADHKQLQREYHCLEDIRYAIEALLALDCYYDLLSDADYIRMYSNYEEYVTIKNTAGSKYRDYHPDVVRFDYYRLTRYTCIFEVDPFAQDDN